MVYSEVVQKKSSSSNLRQTLRAVVLLLSACVNTVIVLILFRVPSKNIGKVCEGDVVNNTAVKRTGYCIYFVRRERSTYIHISSGSGGLFDNVP